MAVEQKKRGSINQGLIVLSGLIFLVGAILIYLFILRGVFGKFNDTELLPNSRVIKDVVYGKKATVAILYSKYTENMLPQGSTWLNDNINTWKKFLTSDHYKCDVIADSTIELGRIFKYKLVILPGSKSLSDKEITELKKYLIHGGSIFATGGTASYSDDGKWRGWQFLSQVYGLKFTKEISRNEFTKIHTLRGGLPITANIPAGYPLRVATWDLPMSVEVLDPRTTQASFWYNYRLQVGLARNQIKKSAGIVYGNYGTGRFVWMGFEINSVIGVQQDYIYFDMLFTNCMKWLLYNPIVLVKNWPSNYNAAAILVPTLSKDVRNINNLLPILRSERVPATFFVSPAEAEINKGLVQTLSKYGDIGTIDDIGYLASANDTVNSLNDYDTQLDKFKNAKTTLESVTHTPVSGAMPYYGLYDQNTIKALINSGYKYIFADSLSDRTVPNLLIRGDSLLVAITKTGRDDYEVIRDYGLTNTNYQFYTYQEDIDRVLFEGGLYTYKFHTGYQCTKKNIGVVRNVINDLKKKNYWITTASAIEKWWAKRNYIETKVSQRGDTRIVLTVSNPGKYAVSNLVLQIYMSVPAKDFSLSTEIIGTKKARYEYDKKTHILYVYLNNLESEESRTYYIDYYKPSV